MSHEDQLSGVDVWGYAGNLAYTRYFTHKGVVDAVLYRTNLDYLKGYTVTGVTHGHDGHLQPREWVLGHVMSCLINLITWISNFKQEIKSNQHWAL